MSSKTVEWMQRAVNGDLEVDPKLGPLEPLESMEDLAGITQESGRTRRALGAMLRLHRFPSRQVDGDGQRAKRSSFGALLLGHKELQKLHGFKVGG